MDELISRQAAIDALCGYLVGKRCPDDGTLTCRLIENEVINKLPLIQPEIVRCKDCKHGVLDDGFPHQYFCVFKGDEWNNADYFCGHAKRREVTTSVRTGGRNAAQESTFLSTGRKQ